MEKLAKYESKAETNQLMQLERVKNKIALIKDINVLKEIHDKSEALRIYCKKAGLGLELQNKCAENKIRVERRAGELIPEQFPHGGDRKSSWTESNLKLEDVGISENQSSNFQKIASITEKKFEEHIADIIKNDEKELTSAGMMRLIEKEKLPIPPLPEGKFNVIYADPPWQYSNVGLAGSAEKHYPTLSVDEILNFKDETEKSVLELFPTNAVLFLWAPNSFLEEGLQVCKEWGFEYKTNFVWIKQKSAYGKLAFYNYGQHEFLFMGIKGSFSPQEGSLVPSILYAEKTTHSKKPEKMYEIIESMYPFPEEEKPYCELFARNKRERWESWGLEVNKYEK